MTDDDFGFDPADTELVRRMQAATPSPGDADAVLTGLRPRLTRARRRRQAGMLAIGTAAIMLLAGVAFAATDATDGSRVRVPPANRSTPSVVTEPAPTGPTTPTEPRTTGSTVPTPTTVSTSTGPAGPSPSTPPTTVDDHGGNRGPGSVSSGSGSSGSGSSGSGTSGTG